MQNSVDRKLAAMIKDAAAIIRVIPVLAIVIALFIGSHLPAVYSLNSVQEKEGTDTPAIFGIYPTVKVFTTDAETMLEDYKEANTPVWAIEVEGESFTKYLKRFLSIPYVHGGMSPDTGFDCSGFVDYIYRHYGIKLARSSQDLWDTLTDIDEPQVGDLVFFNHTTAAKGDEITHVGIYVGNSSMIHAGMEGIQLVSLKYDYWLERLVGFKRVTNNLPS